MDKKWYFCGYIINYKILDLRITMKKVLIATCCIALLSGSLSVSAQTLAGKSWSADNGNGTFTNPLFYDEFSDPDIIRVGEDYYLAGTTMHSVPGLVVLHSKDLVNWEFSSYCFDRFDDSDDFNLRNGKEAYGQGIKSMVCTISSLQIIHRWGACSVPEARVSGDLTKPV